MSDIQDMPVDSRIIKTQYKNYELLARFWNGRYRGRVWKNKEKIADYIGESIDLILDSLVQIVDSVRQNAFNEREESTLQSADFVKAWHGVMPILDKGVLAALRTLARYKSHSVPMSRLIRITGYDNADVVVKMMNEADKALRDELLLEFYDEQPTVYPLCSISPFEVNDRLSSKIMVIDEVWADALLQAEHELEGRSA